MTLADKRALLPLEGQLRRKWSSPSNPLIVYPSTPEVCRGHKWWHKSPARGLDKSGSRSVCWSRISVKGWGAAAGSCPTGEASSRSQAWKHSSGLVTACRQGVGGGRKTTPCVEVEKNPTVGRSDPTTGDPMSQRVSLGGCLFSPHFRALKRNLQGGMGKLVQACLSVIW